MVEACNGRDYAHDIVLHQSDGKLVYNITDINIIKNNILGGSYVDVAPVPVIEEIKPARAKRITILDYLMDIADVDLIRAECWTLDKLAEDYTSRSGKEINPLSIRNRFTLCGISGKTVNGGQHGVLEGNLLADMIEALRSSRGGNTAAKVVPQKPVVPAEAKVVTPAPAPASTGLTVSLGELFDLKACIS